MDNLKHNINAGEATVSYSEKGQKGTQAAGIMGEALGFAKQFGISALNKPKQMESSRTFTETFVNGKKIKDGDNLPTIPGSAYSTHLFKHHEAGKKAMEASKNALTNASKIFTEQMEALKLALGSMGVASERNPGGLPVDFKDARKIWFGSDDVDPIQEAEFRSTIEIGDRKVDPKKIRKFANSDGSLTWEILNDDKTVMSRFTMGEYAGTKLFSQGGYDSFAKLLKKAREKFGPDSKGEFDSIRTMFGG